MKDFKTLTWTQTVESDGSNLYILRPAEEIEQERQEEAKPKTVRQPLSAFRKCPTCGEDSSVDLSRGYGQTLDGYYSPPGHDHDDNCKTYTFRCENGHEFPVIPLNECPACDWVGSSYCVVCGK